MTKFIFLVGYSLTEIVKAVELDKMDRRSTKEEDKEKKFRRLPKCVVPIHYNLSFQPDEYEPILDGRMSVKVQVCI